MKQKIVIKVPMHSQKAKSKAMQIAVAVEGVSSVSSGKENDQLEVIGEGVDSVCLAKSLRKKFCFADIITVEEVKPPAADKSKGKCDEKCPPPPCLPPPCLPPPCQPCYYQCYPVYDVEPPICSIM